MDTTVKARFFHVSEKPEEAPDLPDLLLAETKRPISDRERDVSGTTRDDTAPAVTLRLEQCEAEGEFVTGQFCRKQTINNQHSSSGRPWPKKRIELHRDGASPAQVKKLAPLVARELGRKGGRRRAESLSAKRLSEIDRKSAEITNKKRWGSRRMPPPPSAA
jgi:hypothetical protein